MDVAFLDNAVILDIDTGTILFRPVLDLESGNDSQAAGAQKSSLAIAGLVLSILAICFGAGCLICTVCAGNAIGCASLEALKYR